MNVDLAEQLLNELGSSLENLETQIAALLQFLKDNGVVTDDQFAPYLTKAGNASNVRWRAARVRLQHLFLAEREKEEKLRENEQRQKAAQAQNQSQDKDVKGENDAAKAAPHGKDARSDGAGDREQPISEKDDKRDKPATSQDKSQS
jgi:uncharacterized protein YdaU (DUF1376 family)